ncbi:MAG: hypothetical protein HYY86_03635 [Candidatus Harrisonbacteria bacterium]|nr:hypothetical protein [Candidatus Harrisonbacteria bacterium]
MKESMLSPEEKRPPTVKESILKSFQRFRNRPDKPKYTYEEQLELGERSKEVYKKFLKEKTPETEKAHQELSAKFLESKADKKHISAIQAPLSAIELFLESKNSEYIPETKRGKLFDKVNDLFKKLETARQQENISDELVAEVLNFLDEMEIYLK